ncbi:MAG: YggT family protein, partial [Dolichospermum sp.]
MTGLNLTVGVLGPFLGVMTFLFIFRIILTWYPQVHLNRLPFSLIAWPTEPFLIPLRK